MQRAPALEPFADAPTRPRPPHLLQLAPKFPDAPTFTALPETGLAAADVSTALAKLSDLPRTEWEGGRVSGAVYHGGKEMGDIWRDAFSRFEVSNPLHADVFPGASFSPLFHRNTVLGYASGSIEPPEQSTALLSKPPS